MGEIAADIFFPKNCLNCGKERRYFCESCANSLFFMDSRFCPFCGKLSDMFSVCSACRGNVRAEKVFSVLSYGHPLSRKIIKNFKYRYLRGLARDLDPLFRRFFEKFGTLLDKNGAALVPVPLHWYKECERGFNQAEELAEIIGNIFSLPVMRDIVKKSHRTKNQAELGPLERRDNLRGAFEIKKTPPESVILVDDVFTTGETAKELALALSLAGAKKIQIITLARG